MKMRFISIVMMICFFSPSVLSAFRNGDSVFNDSHLSGPGVPGSDVRILSEIDSSLRKMRFDSKRAHLSPQKWSHYLERSHEALRFMLRSTMEDIGKQREEALKDLSAYYSQREQDLAELRERLLFQVPKEAKEMCADEIGRFESAIQEETGIMQQWLEFNINKCVTKLWAREHIQPRYDHASKIGHYNLQWPSSPNSRFPIEYEGDFDPEMNPKVNVGEVLDRQIPRGVLPLYEEPIQAHMAYSMGARMFGLRINHFKATFYSYRDQKMKKFFEKLDGFQNAWYQGFSQIREKFEHDAGNLSEGMLAFKEKLDDFEKEIGEFLKEEELLQQEEKELDRPLVKMLIKLQDRFRKTKLEKERQIEIMAAKARNFAKKEGLAEKLSNLDKQLLSEQIALENAQLMKDLDYWKAVCKLDNLYLHYANAAEENYKEWVRELVTLLTSAKHKEFRGTLIKVACLAYPKAHEPLAKLTENWFCDYFNEVFVPEVIPPVRACTPEAKEVEKVWKVKAADEYWRPIAYQYYCDQHHREIFEVPVAWYQRKVGEYAPSSEELLRQMDEVLVAEERDYCAYIEKYLNWAWELELMVKKKLEEVINSYFDRMEIAVLNFQPSSIW